MAIKKTLLNCATLFILLITEVALADWTVSFNEPLNNKSAISASISGEVTNETLTTLAVELDNIDVSELLSYEGQKLTFTPIEALSLGTHTIRLLIIQPDGSSIEKAQWSFNIRPEMVSKKNTVAVKASNIAAAEKWLKSSSFSADTQTELSYRVKSKSIGGNLPDHTVLTGSGNVQSTLSGEKLSLTMSGNYFVQSEKDLALTGKRVDLGEYRIAAKYAGEAGNANLILGHHDLGLNSILMSNFYRRGLSAEISDNEQRITANIFSFNPESLAGSEDFTGLSDSKNRLEGASISVKPFSTAANALTVTGLYYDGEKSTAGIAANDSDKVSTGSGWGLIIETKLLDEKVDIRGEYANSQYDLDGDFGLAPEDNSDAISLDIKARPFNTLYLFNAPMDIIFGTKYERVDTFFQSLANPGIFSDHETVTATSDVYWGGLSTNLQWSNETNNVDDLINAPTDKLRDFNWSTQYAFARQKNAFEWLGSPSLSFYGFVSDLDRDKTPTGYTGPDTDFSSESYTVEGRTNYKAMSWSLSHQYSTFDDNNDLQSDTVNNLSSLGFYWTPSNSLSLNSSIQYDVLEDKDVDINTHTGRLNFGINSVLVKDKINLSLNYNLNHSSGNGDSQESYTINSELGWTIRAATTNNPGLSLALRGSLGNTKGSNTIDENNYQIFAILRVTAAVSTDH